MSNSSDFKKRYLSKAFANFANLVANLLTQVLLSRGLGPKLFGDFGFLSNSFTQITNIADVGTSNAYFTKLSQRPGERALVAFYHRFVVIIAVLVVGGAALALGFGFGKGLWPGIAPSLVLLAAVTGVLAWGGGISVRVTDALALTVRSEIFRAIHKLAAVGLLFIILFVTVRLTVGTVFVYLIFTWVSFILIQVYILRRSRQKYQMLDSLSADDFWKYSKEFYNYCAPLVVYSVVASSADLLDRWLLQLYSGSVQQGYFTLGSQVGAACFLLVGSMTPLVQREFSIAFQENNEAKASQVFERFAPLMYSFAAMLCAFVVVQASRVTGIIGGHSYAEAGMAVTALALYPVHQTYGQFSGALLLANSKTKLIRNIGVLGSILGIPVTLFFIMPAKYFGLNSGALGLAWKLLLVQVLTVNIQLFYCTRLLKIGFIKLFLHQFVSLAVMLLYAWGAQALVVSFVPHLNDILNLMLTFPLYVVAVLLTARVFPWLTGMQKKDFSFLEKMVARLSRSKQE